MIKKCKFVLIFYKKVAICSVLILFLFSCSSEDTIVNQTLRKPQANNILKKTTIEIANTFNHQRGILLINP